MLEDGSQVRPMHPWGLMNNSSYEADQSENAFPSLAELALSSRETGSKSTDRLVSKSVKCPCGRKKTHYVIRESEDPPPLKCDSICRLEGRKDQLDDAFGISRSSHISVFERRQASWSGNLLMLAKRDVSTIKMLEKEFETFLRSNSLRYVNCGGNI